MARAMVEIEPRLPQVRVARKRPAARPRRPSGKTARAMAMWPFSTRVKCSRNCFDGASDDDGARHVGRAVEILRAGIDEIDAASDLQIARFRHAIMRDRRMFAERRKSSGRRCRASRHSRAGRFRAPRAAEISVSLPFGAASENQARKRVSAAPSRICAARAPSSSAFVLDRFRAASSDRRRDAACRPPCARIRRVSPAPSRHRREWSAPRLPACARSSTSNCEGESDVEKLFERRCVAFGASFASSM